MLGSVWYVRGYSVKSCHDKIDGNSDVVLLCSIYRDGKHAIETFDSNDVRVGVKFIKIPSIITAYMRLSGKPVHWYCLKCGKLVEED